MLLVVLSSCSTQKNTWATRSYHQTKVKYNILHNGNLAFDDGLKAINNANEDDYSTILNLYPVSNHQAAEASKTQMDRTIEKCRKCIKLHSIKAKPKPDPKRRNDPEYKLWLQQEEFNNQMGNAWIRLGEAEFHKGDFLGSIGTFTYVTNHYQYDPDMIARCQLWIARAYGELGWLYEAEDMLSKVQMDALSRKHATLYSAVSADIYLKLHRYHEAIPFVKIATPAEKRKVYRPRFQFVLGQLYELEGNRKAALDAYKKVIKLTPPNVMDFNTRIRMAQLEGKSGIKALKKMTRQDKNKDNLVEIYSTIGHIYLQSRDTAEALSYYQQAIQAESPHQMAKAAVLVRAGDLYYDRRDYIAAQPCYREACSIIPAEQEDYPRIQRRSETLDELIVEYTTVQLQDSLQRLSHMSDEEQRAVIDRLIADLIEQEKAAEEAARQAARDAKNNDGLQSVNTSNMLGGGSGNTDWYFYNPQLIRTGRQEFSKRWGSRPLEDNWRRLIKTSTTPMDQSAGEDDSDELEADSLLTDSTKATIAPVATDVHQPEFYLQQIPRTPEQLAESDTAIAAALYNMFYIYHDKMEDEALARETLDDLHRRFPRYVGLVDIYYTLYLSALKADDTATANRYRTLLMTDFPASTEATIVSQPDYFDRLRHMAVEQDSLYEATYTAFRDGRFAEVKQSKTYAENAYPLSPLMPRFLFLNAIAVARTEGQDAFIDQLRDMISRYPSSELGAMAKDMLAMMGQGLESQTGALTSKLDELRMENVDVQDSASLEQRFSTERHAPSYVLIMLPKADDKVLNNMLYEVALFNFSQFLIRDFDLQRLPAYAGGCALRIAGLDSMDEAEWYEGLLLQNPEVTEAMRQQDAHTLVITEDNFPLLGTRFTESEYRDQILK